MNRGANMSEADTETVRGNFVLLRAGTLRLLLPQEDVGAAEYLEARPVPGARPGVMRLEQDGTSRRLVAPSARMALLAECPAERFVVATLSGGDGTLWCWDDLQVLIEVQLRTVPIPPVLVAPHTPVDRYAEHQGEIAFMCSARHLAEFALASES
jgi:hypothetical protein